MFCFHKLVNIQARYLLIGVIRLCEQIQALYVRISSVDYSIWETTVDEHT